MVGGGGGGVGPQMNKFGHVSSDNVGEGGVGLKIWWGVPGLMFGGGGRSHMSPGLMPEVGGGGAGALLSDLFHDSCDVPTPSPLWTDRRLWKHYLPGTSFAGGNYSRNDQKLKFLICDLLFMPYNDFPRSPPPAPPRVEWCINGRSVTRKQRCCCWFEREDVAPGLCKRSN